MKKVHYFVAFAMIFVVIYSCHTPSKTSENWVKQAKGRYKCDLTNEFSVEQRKNMYPFNQAATVLFIAYENFQIARYQTKSVMDTTYTIDGKQIITEKVINMTYEPCSQQKVIKEWQLTNEQGENVEYCAIESIQLNQEQIDTLSNILFNYKVVGKGTLFVSIYGCYFPRNSIIFLDKTGKPICFIEICFECKRIIGSNSALDKVASVSLCDEKLNKLDNLFGSVGIHYGIDVRY